MKGLLFDDRPFPHPLVFLFHGPTDLPFSTAPTSTPPPPTKNYKQCLQIESWTQILLGTPRFTLRIAIE